MVRRSSRAGSPHSVRESAPLVNELTTPCRPGDGHESEQSTHRRPGPDRRSRDSRRRHRLLCARRELPRGSRRPARRARNDHDDYVPARGRRREHGRSLRQAHRAAWNRDGHPRGPGACHATIGLHNASQDSTPMILLIGQVERGHSDREAFQEIEYRRFLEPLCKWVVQIDDPARIPELVSQAFHRACSGRPGPVAVAMPEDVLVEETTVADAGPYTGVSPGVAADALPALRTVLAQRAAPDGHRRWRRLVRAGERGPRTIRRGERARHRRVVPLPGSSGQHPSLLRRRPGARNRSEACRAGARRRPPGGGRRPARGDDDARLPTRHAAASAAAVRARPSRPRGARAGVSAHPRNLRGLRRVPACRGGHAPRGLARLAGFHSPRPPGVPGVGRTDPRASRTRGAGRRSCHICGKGCRRRPS